MINLNLTQRLFCETKRSLYCYKFPWASESASFLSLVFQRATSAVQPAAKWPHTRISSTISAVVTLVRDHPVSLNWKISVIKGKIASITGTHVTIRGGRSLKKGDRKRNVPETRGSVTIWKNTVSFQKYVCLVLYPIAPVGYLVERMTVFSWWLAKPEMVSSLPVWSFPGAKKRYHDLIGKKNTRFRLSKELFISSSDWIVRVWEEKFEKAPQGDHTITRWGSTTPVVISSSSCQVQNNRLFPNWSDESSLPLMSFPQCHCAINIIFKLFI